MLKTETIAEAPDLRPPRRRQAKSRSTLHRLTATQLCEVAQAAAAATFGVPLSQLRSTRRESGPVTMARQSAIYLAHVAFGLDTAAVARAFGRDRSTVAHACRRIEDRRDDPFVDAVFDAIEIVCRQRAGVARGAS